MTNQEQPSSREIIRRIVVTGYLRLLSPTALGNGDAESLTDMPLLLDTAGDQPLPLLTGTSIAGALRNYLRTREKGFAEPEDRASLAVELFGAIKGDSGSGNGKDPGGEQSRLIVDDALAQDPALAEVRDGVRIDGYTRTAIENFKYDLELLPAGTIFPLRFELLISQKHNEERLKAALALALHGLETQEISLGGRKSRGFGRCVVEQWRVTVYNLRDSSTDLLAWLAADHPEWNYTPTEQPATGSIANALFAPPNIDKRRSFSITATFALESPLLIRSEETLDNGAQPDVSQIRNSQKQPIIPGTSLAGVLRARAERIINTLGIPSDLNSLFGQDMQSGEKKPTASRLLVHESVIEGGSTLVQNRVAIDRFTGGAFDTALFSEAPQVGGSVQLTFSLREAKQPNEWEKGLLLLLLKDLWTGDLPLGGTSSIGRGRLHGLHATIIDNGDVWEMVEHGGTISVAMEARTKLESYVAALNNKGA